MPIYTRRGDRGETSLVDGSRVPKDSPRVEAYGTVDELNSLIGFARAANDEQALDDVLRFLQQRLFNCSSCLATSGSPTASTPGILAEDVAFIEKATDRFAEQGADFKGFVLEAGGELVTRLHVARAVARRAERRIVTLARTEAVDEQLLAFVNRLSDLLFTAARYAAARSGDSEELWDPQAEAPDLG